MKWDDSKDIFYPWSKEDYHRQCFFKGEPVEVIDVSSGPIGTARIGKGVITFVRKHLYSGGVAYSYFVDVDSLGLSGDISQRHLRPLLSDAQLKDKLLEKLESVYKNIHDDISGLNREEVCKGLSLLERMKKITF